MNNRVLYASSVLAGVFGVKRSGLGTVWKRHCQGAETMAPAAAKTSAKSGPAKAAQVDFAAHNAVVNKYCAGCHNDNSKAGGLSLAGVDLAKIGQHGELGEKIRHEAPGGHDASCGYASARCQDLRHSVECD